MGWFQNRLQNLFSNDHQLKTMHCWPQLPKPLDLATHWEFPLPSPIFELKEMEDTHLFWVGIQVKRYKSHSFSYFYCYASNLFAGSIFELKKDDIRYTASVYLTVFSAQVGPKEKWTRRRFMA